MGQAAIVGTLTLRPPPFAAVRDSGLPALRLGACTERTLSCIPRNSRYFFFHIHSATAATATPSQNSARKSSPNSGSVGVIA